MGFIKTTCMLLGILLSNLYVYAQNISGTSAPEKKEIRKQWFETFAIRGYVQARYNRLLETNKSLKCEQCDRSIGDNGGIFLRRGRIIFSGQLNERTYFYIQPDFASQSGTGQNFIQLRDAYVDYGFDKKNEFRIRVGQSKVPYGFENMQSSQNRLPLDRNDALNSALSNERDLAAFFYWAPEKTRKQFASFVADGLKGSGDYGVVGFGVFNGQTANRLEANNNLHVVARVSYPITIGNQIIEPGIQAYTGKVVIPVENRTANVKSATDFQYKDDRVAASFVLYPKPFGILAEYTYGQGPEYQRGTDSITTQKLWGGFATLFYLIKNKKGMTFMPFTRLQAYNGGKKHELDARSYTVREMETGLEWQINKNFELTTSYVISNRRFEDFKLKNNTQHGNFLRLQVQLNY
jgi:Phosphate-selective porin O and P